MKTKHTFKNLSILMKAAENNRNFGMTLIMFDDLSGKVVSYTDDCEELEIFSFSSIAELFHGFYQLSLPNQLMN